MTLFQNKSTKARQAQATFEAHTLAIQKAGMRHNDSYLAGIACPLEYKDQLQCVVALARALCDTKQVLEIEHEKLGRIVLQIPEQGATLDIQLSSEQKPSIY